MEPVGIKPVDRHDLFGGEGRVRVWNLMGATQMPPFTAALACELAPGGSVGRHLQQASHELVITLSGEGVATVDGESQALECGSVVHLPLGRHLTLANRSTEKPLHYLIVKAS